MEIPLKAMIHAQKTEKMIISSAHVPQADQHESPGYSMLYPGTPSMPNNRDLTKSSSMKLCRKKVKTQMLLPKRKGERTNTSSE